MKSNLKYYFERERNQTALIYFNATRNVVNLKCFKNDCSSSTIRWKMQNLYQCDHKHFKHKCFL